MAAQKMKEKKKVFYRFPIEECDAFAQYLNRMARDGWHFVSKDFIGMTFEKGTPMNSNYRVEVFFPGKVQEFEYSSDREEFQEYALAAGWEIVDAKGSIIIFKAVREDTVPLFTDEERYENIFTEEKRQIVPGFISALFITGLFLYNLLDDAETIFSKDIYVMPMVVGLALLVHLIRFAYYALDKKKKQAELDRDTPLFFGVAYPGTIFQRIKKNAANAVLVLLLLVCIWMMVDLGGFQENTSVNHVPLQISDVRDWQIPVEECSIWQDSSSVFGSMLSYSIHYSEDDHFYCQVVKSKYPYFLKKIWKENVELLFDDEDVEFEDGTIEKAVPPVDVHEQWGARKAFAGDGTICMLYDDAYVEVSNLNYTDEEIGIVRAKLGVR